MNVKEINTNFNEFRKLAQEHGTVFSDPAWLELFGDQLHLYGIFDAADKLVGAFNLWHTRLYGLRYLKNPLTTPHCALIYRNEADTLYKRNSFEKSIHTGIAAFLKSKPAGIIQFTLPPEVTDVQPYLWQGFKASPTYTYRLDLSPAFENITSRFDGKLRSDINKAQKDGVSVTQTVEMTTVREIVKKTLESKAAGVSFELIDKILNQFASPENSFAFVASSENKAVATAFCIHDTTTAYYILGGYDPDIRQRGAAAFVLQSAIQHAKEMGLKTFDFEGSMIPSIESFFRGFGGELVPKFAIHRAWLPVEVLLKLVKRSVY